MGYVAAAFQLIGGISSFLGAQQAKKDARRAAAEERRLEGLVTDAKINSLDTEQRVLRGQTIAQAAGANVKIDRGSPLTIMTEQARTFADEKRVTRQAGASRAALANTRGRMVGNQAYYAGLSASMASVSSAFSLFAAAKGP